MSGAVKGVNRASGGEAALDGAGHPRNQTSAIPAPLNTVAGQRRFASLPG
jgi:hypothetical protein